MPLNQATVGILDDAQRSVLLALSAWRLFEISCVCLRCFLGVFTAASRPTTRFNREETASGSPKSGVVPALHSPCGRCVQSSGTKGGTRARGTSPGGFGIGRSRQRSPRGGRRLPWERFWSSCRCCYVSGRSRPGRTAGTEATSRAGVGLGPPDPPRLGLDRASLKTKRAGAGMVNGSGRRDASSSEAHGCRQGRRASRGAGS